MPRTPKLSFLSRRKGTKSDEAHGPGVTRRNFLRVSGLAFSGATLPTALTACHHRDGPGPQSIAVDFTATITRPDDMLSLEVGFINLVLRGAQVAAKDASQASFLVVTFPRQHVLEEAFWEEAPAAGDGTHQAPGSTLNAAASPPVRALLSSTSRVVLRVPDRATIDYTIEGLLKAFADFDMSIMVNATPADGAATSGAKAASVALGGASGLRAARVLRAQGISATTATIHGLNLLPRPGALEPNPYTHDPRVIQPDPNLFPGAPFEPRNYETSIEVPTRLVLSPNAYGGWAHTTTAPTATATGRVELWHTRLGVRRADGVVDEVALASLRTVRAVWARDSVFTIDPTFAQHDDYIAAGDFEASLRHTDRAKIVYESGNFNRGKGEAAPRAVDVNRLMLTSLGGYLDARGDFGDVPTTGLSLWEHRATLGRDQYVKTVQTGVLFPFGHRAVLVTITERKVHPGSPPIAYLWKRQFIVIKQPVRVYGTPAEGGTDPNDQRLRTLPYSAIEITTLVTPNLEPRPMAGPGMKAYYMPKVLGSGEYFRFAMTGLDRAGRPIKFEAPALWVPTFKGNLDPGLSIDALQADYAGADPGPGPIAASLHGQRVAYAVEGADPDTTTHETHEITHGGAAWAKPPAGEVGFLPFVDKGAIALEAARHLTGNENVVPFTYHNAFTTNGFDGGANVGELLLQLTDGLDLGFHARSDKSGGFLSPDMTLRALSRKLGAVADAVTTAGDAASAIASGTFDPATFFGTLNKAKLFGIFGLGDVLQAGGLDQAPKLVTQALGEVDALLADVGRIKSELEGLKAGGKMPPELQAVLDAAAVVLTDITTPKLVELATSIPSLAAALGGVPGVLTGPSGAIVPPGLSKHLRTLSDQMAGTLSRIGSDIGKLVSAYHAGEEAVKSLTVRFDWRAKLQALPKGASGGDAIFDPRGGLVLAAEMRAKASGGKPSGLDMVCSLDDFDLNLIGGVLTFVSLHFKQVQFVMKAGKKPDIDVQFDKSKSGGIEFKGPLSFVNTLKDIIPFDGFSDPPALSVTPAGIDGSFSLAIPNIAVGMFALQNISLGAGFKIPFIGDPLSLRFNFCTRENPFHLIVMALGGGGFFGITLYPDRVHILEAAFEFGAQLSVDFGVASGSVSIMAGVYFKLEDGAATITGYLRIRGEVDVLGLISASIELYMELTYEAASGKVIGRATLTIEIHICFLSKSVSISCEKKFAGANGDPTFAEMMSPCTSAESMLPAPFASCELGYDPWAEYVEAFAA